MRASVIATLVVTALALAGCKDEHKTAATSGTPIDDTRLATLRAIAALPGMPKTVQFRGVQAYAQAAPHHTAVCGLVTPFADDTTIYVPFVIIANETTPPRAQDPHYEFEAHLGTTTMEASRTYLALIADCWDKGGPAPERPLALAPLPDNLPDPHLPPAATADPAPLAKPQVITPVSDSGQSTPASGTVTVRQSANVHATPGGATVRTVQAGQTFTVFATAPGGWYELGDAAPIGWVHESMLNR